MAVVNFGTNGLSFIAQVFCDETAETATVIAVGDGTPSSSGLGNEHTIHGFARGAATASYLNTSQYPHTLKISKTFTASGANVEVTEFAIYSSGGTPTLIAYVQFGAFELSNGGIVPDGQSILLEFYFTFSKGTSSVTGDNTNDAEYTNSINVTKLAVGTIDPTQFTCSTSICFNGIPLRNGYIVTYNANRAGMVWEIECQTDSLSDIDSLSNYSSPISSGYTVTGERYVNSLMAGGALKIIDSTGTYETYSGCYIDGDIQYEQFGEVYFYKIKIVKAGV